MNTITADLDRLSTRAEDPLLREGDVHCPDAVVVWNGMVARFPALHRATSAHDVAAGAGVPCEHGAARARTVVS